MFRSKNPKQREVNYESKCVICESSTTNPLDYKCTCGSPLELHIEAEFSKNRVRKHDYSTKRYKDFFTYLNEEKIVSLGEGWTPLVNFEKNLYFKLDFLNPTGSFKDRGSTILISAISDLVKRAGGYISEDSSGNAGASIAAYGAKAGLKTKIYVPATVSGQKFNQIMFYGAEVERVKGARSKVTAEAQKPEKGKYYVGHIWHPIFRDGIRTLAYEIAEQLRWELPSRIYLPLSAGTLLLGVIQGLEHLVESGVAEELPTVVACQTEQVSPLYHRLKDLPYTPPDRITSIADALVSVNPPLLELMVTKMRETSGRVEVLSETRIKRAFLELAKRGVFVEPSSAVAYAAYKKHFENSEISINEKTVVVLTGFGLKTRIESE